MLQSFLAIKNAQYVNEMSLIASYIYLLRAIELLFHPNVYSVHVFHWDRKNFIKNFCLMGQHILKMLLRKMKQPENCITINLGAFGY